METTNPLGEYLKARRQLVMPEDVGLPRGSRRRVAGLRREELALMAGISPDYYLRLEQGRDRNPSIQVLDSLAAVLNLDEDGIDYLYRLAHVAPASVGSHERREEVPSGVAELIDQMPVPVFIQGRFMDVLAANRLARALSPRFKPGTNLLRAVFLDPTDKELHLDWNRATEESVAGLRTLVGPDLDDPHLRQLVEELSHKSERFRQLWQRQDVLNKAGGPSFMRHPLVGDLELRHEKLLVMGATGQVMIMYHAVPGSPSHAALARLASAVE